MKKAALVLMAASLAGCATLSDRHSGYEFCIIVTSAVLAGDEVEQGAFCDARTMYRATLQAHYEGKPTAPEPRSCSEQYPEAPRELRDRYLARAHFEPEGMCWLASIFRRDRASQTKTQ